MNAIGCLTPINRLREVSAVRVGQSATSSGSSHTYTVSGALRIFLDKDMWTRQLGTCS